MSIRDAVAATAPPSTAPAVDTESPGRPPSPGTDVKRELRRKPDLRDAGFSYDFRRHRVSRTGKLEAA